MKTRQMIGSAAVAMACFAGAAAAQDFDRRGPNVMPAPQQGGNSANNTNTYDKHAGQTRGGSNAMQAPESQAAPRGTPGAQGQQRAPGANGSERAENRSSPNIAGDPAGFAAERRDNGRRTDAIPGCNRCVAI